MVEFLIAESARAGAEILRNPLRRGSIPRPNWAKNLTEIDRAETRASQGWMSYQQACDAGHIGGVDGHFCQSHRRFCQAETASPPTQPIPLGTEKPSSTTLSNCCIKHNGKNGSFQPLTPIQKKHTLPPPPDARCRGLGDVTATKSTHFYPIEFVAKNCRFCRCARCNTLANRTLGCGNTR